MSESVIKYFEPNHIDYNIEDLCIGVKLEICYMSRALNKQEVYEGEVVMGKPNKSFFEGEDGFLTTSYTDITLMDLISGGNKETIGIESISIKYNSWYFPEVTIKFVDVRGNALFNPMELTNDAEYVNVAQGSFFKGFFTFPYPIFKLTVKGYFGLPITFNLTIKDIPRSVFNSTTGNFELTVNFIGHLYSYLTDIPMTLLMISPYIQYNGVNADLGKFENGVSVPTIPEFIKATGLVVANFNQSDVISKNFRLKDELKTAVENANEILISLREIETVVSQYYEMGEKQENGKTIFRFKKGSLSIGTFSNYNDLLIFIKDNIDNIHKRYQKLTIKRDIVMLRNDANAIENTEQTIYLYYDIEADIKKYTTLITHITDRQHRIAKAISDEKERVFYNTYGWQPSVKNIIHMFIQHLLKLNKNIETCLCEIIDQSPQRNINNLTCLTDIPSSVKDITAYPFLRFLNKRHEILWIGDTEAKNYAERKLVDQIITSSQKMTKNLSISLQEYEMLNRLSRIVPMGGVASLWYDIKGENVYASELKKYGSVEDFCKPKTNNDIPEVLKFLAKRYTDAFLFNGNSECLTTFMPETEAINFLSSAYSADLFSESSFWGTEKVSHISLFEQAIRVQQQAYLNEFKKNHLNGGEGTYDRMTGGLEAVLDNLTARTVITNESLRKITFSKNYSIEQYYFSKRVYGNNSNGNGGYTPFDNKKTLYIKLPNKLLDIKSEDEYNSYISNYRQTIAEHGIDENLYNEVFHYASDVSPTRHMGAFDEKKSKTLGMGNIMVGSRDEQITMRDGAYVFNDIEEWWDNVVDIGCYSHGKNDYTQILSFTYYYSYEHPEFTIETENDADGLINDFLLSMGYRIGIEDLTDFNVGGVIKCPLISFLAVGSAIKYKSVYAFNVDPMEWDFDTHEEKVKDWFFNSNFAKVILSKYNELSRQIANRILEAVRSPENEARTRTYELYGSKYEHFYCVLDKSALRDVKTLFTDNIFLFFPYRLTDGELKFCVGDVAVEGADVDNQLPSSAPETVDRFINKVREYIFKTPQDEEILGDVNRKIGIYDTLKNLYDKWKFGAEEISPMEINHKIITINDFVFRNALNQDIGDSLNVNIEKIIDLLVSIYKGETEMSLYNFLFEICSYADCLLLSLPLNVFDATSTSGRLQRMFTPHPFNTGCQNTQGQTFIVTYRQKDSQHLNFGSNSEYSDDGIDFTNDSVVSDMTDTTFGAFGVTYGMNKQSMFKNIQVSMDKPIVSEQSIASTLYIAEQGGKSGSNRIGATYHDVFDTFSNHSYQCSVDMLGNAQLMPMMYFQLNNIPFFKGGYFITAVEHNINTQGMTTKFTGNRINVEQFILSQSSVVSFNGDSGTITELPTTTEINGSATSENSKTFVTYTKENTMFIINPGRIMTDRFFESPDLETHGRMSMEYIKGKRQNGEDDDILQPFDINGEVVNRYREYWGNRKLATELMQKMTEGGYNAQLGTSISKDSTEYISVNFTDKTQIDDKFIIIINLYHDHNRRDIQWTETNKFIVYSDENKVSQKLAKAIQHQVLRALATSEIGKGLVYEMHMQRKQPNRPLRGFDNVKAPAVIGMNLNVTNKAHVLFLSKKEHRDKIVTGYVNGIEKFFTAVKNDPIEIKNVNIDEMLSNYFSYSELTRTEQIDPETGKIMTNIPNATEKQNLITLATTILDKVREKYGKPIWVESGFRCEKVNTAVKGKAGSQHKTGSAADLYAMDMVHNAPIFWAAYDLIQSGEITVGQLIWEFGTNKQPGWVHISLPNRANGITNEFLCYYIGTDGKEHSKSFKVEDFIRVDE